MFTDDATYNLVLLVGLGMSVLTAVASLFVKTPYGRFASDKLGPTVPQRLGWLLLECPALIVFPVVYAMGPRTWEPVPLFFAALWAMHYANRALLFPLTMKVRKGARMGISVPATGWVVVPIHAWLYATWYSGQGTHLTPDWLTDPRFGLGLVIYLSGFGLILHSEATLRRLREDREVPEGASSYRIPYGGGFRFVSSPHYLGEITAWVGLAIASWCPGGLFILTISLANLVPRALATHRWYHEHFADYPKDRRAMFPFIW